MGISFEDDNTVLSDEEWIDMQDHDGDDFVSGQRSVVLHTFHLVW